MRYFVVGPIIRVDAAGDGHFGAPRGSRTHNGVDYCCTPGGFVHSPVDGTVTKLGYCYTDDPYWRYVEVTDDSGLRHRLFYTLPLVLNDELVTAGQIIGEAQDVSQRYPGQGMKPHVHYEIMDASGSYINPETV